MYYQLGMIFPTLFNQIRAIIKFGYQYYTSNKKYKNGSLLLDTLYLSLPNGTSCGPWNETIFQKSSLWLLYDEWFLFSIQGVVTRRSFISDKSIICINHVQSRKRVEKYEKNVQNWVMDNWDKPRRELLHSQLS